MNKRSVSKIVRLANTLLFMLSLGYMIVWTLQKADKTWWFIIPFSGYSAVILFHLMGLYSFAIFRGVARSQKIDVEHPLTCSAYYSLFYDLSPLLGALAGVLATTRVNNVNHYPLLIAAGSLWVTFFVWIIIDPVVGFAEMMLPSSRKNHRKRLAKAKVVRKRERLANERMLAEMEAKEEIEQNRWREILSPYAETLAYLVTSEEISDADKLTGTIDTGVNAWQMGGLSCMQQLYSMAIEKIRESKQGDEEAIDQISIWWDGIGSWRCRWLEGENESVSEKGILSRI